MEEAARQSQDPRSPLPMACTPSLGILPPRPSTSPPTPQPTPSPASYHRTTGCSTPTSMAPWPTRRATPAQGPTQAATLTKRHIRATTPACYRPATPTTTVRPLRRSAIRKLIITLLRGCQTERSVCQGGRKTRFGAGRSGIQPGKQPIWDFELIFFCQST